MLTLQISLEELEAFLNEAIVRANEPTQYRSMTYGQGILDALEYITGRTQDNPLE